MGRIVSVYVVMMAAAASCVPAVAAFGGWQRVDAASPAAPRQQHAGGLRMEEQLHHAKLRLRASTTAAGQWVIAKKEKVLTEEEIYAEKVRKFARSVDQVPAPNPSPCSKDQWHAHPRERHTFTLTHTTHVGDGGDSEWFHRSVDYWVDLRDCNGVQGQWAAGSHG